MNDKLDSCSPKIAQPESIDIDLKEHQKTSTYAMSKLENDGKIIYKELTIETNVGILSDRPGSGKSMMIISLISNNIIPTLHKRIHYGSPFVCLKDNNQDYLLKTNLLIVPYKLVSQWASYFKYCKNLKIYQVTTKNDLSKLSKIESYDVIICSDLRYKTFFDLFGNYKWSRIILDEVDMLKLPSQFSWNGVFIWLITNNPEKLLFSNKNFLRMIFKNLSGYLLKFLIIKNKDEFLDKSLNLPKLSFSNVKCKNPINLKTTKNYINSELMKIIKNKEYDKAIELLNCNVDSKSKLCNLLTVDIENSLHDKKLEKDYYQKSLTSPNKEKKVENLDKEIIKLNIQIKSIKNKIQNVSTSTCGICFEKYTKPTVMNCCKNIFCFNCIITTAHSLNNCPYCRAPINIKELNVIGKKKKNISNLKKKSEEVLYSKVENIIKIIENNIKGKFLINLNNNKFYDKIIKSLEKHKINYSNISGNQNMIKNIIKQFNKGSITVIIINSQNDIIGLDLAMTTDIIQFEKLEKENESILISRAYRVGRTQPLKIHNLIYETNYTEEQNNLENYNI